VIFFKLYNVSVAILHVGSSY